MVHWEHFVQEAHIEKMNKILNLPSQVIGEVRKTAEVILNTEILKQQAADCHEKLFSNERGSNVWGVEFPKTGETELNRWLGLVILLTGLEGTMNYYQSKGISEEVLIDTFRDVKLWIDHYHDKYGVWGLEQNHWLTNHFTGRLFKLGRLQYIAEKFNNPIRVFRCKKDNKVVAISEGGIVYRGDGQINGTCNVTDSEAGWTSFFYEDEAKIEGSPISPYGYASKETIKLNKSEWELALSKGDTVIDIHIPASGKLNRDLCKQSVLSAEEFFYSFFPEIKYKAYHCTTWLFDSQYQKILPKNSNIVQFQREFYLYPLRTSDNAVWERVFGKRLEDLASAPKDTVLRRAVIDYYEGGYRLHDAGGFILKEDLNWGQEVYQGTASIQSILIRR